MELLEFLFGFAVDAFLQNTVLVFEPLRVRIADEKVVVVSYLLVLDIIEHLLVGGDKGEDLI